MRHDRTQSLRLVLTLAERAETEAAKQLQQQRQQLQAQSSQLQQLSDYNQEYTSQIGQLGAVNVQQMVGQRNFLSQLHQLLHSQTQTVDLLQQQTDRAQTLWYQRYQRRKKLAELIEQVEREQDQQRNQQLQKELDEMSRHLYSEGLVH
ncbi:flagellar export protein FliJ [Halioxenophilus sp. WMMB6]|uniref:flagellar export protein FliJ n=1 Tax=Halioxenophilus sp. WMMB6 TaxID=3073815 RepID=UPI00295F3CF9|nr:flagellar export protein FliJ [Halioxenophilus sp. WMMB6]